VKKAAHKQKSAAKAASLLNELKKLAGAMAEEDLDTLVDRARILIHNRDVLESAGRLKKAAESLARKQGAREQYALKVKVREAADLSYFFIDFYGYENFFSRDEMRKIVKMCNASADGADAGRRLFNWFKNDRSDVLKNTGLESSRDPILGVIYDYIIRNYSVKK